MPIRTLPLAGITEAVLRDLIRLGVREGHTLDFKRQLKLETPATLTQRA